MLDIFLSHILVCVKVKGKFRLKQEQNQTRMHSSRGLCPWRGLSVQGDLCPGGGFCQGDLRKKHGTRQPDRK